MTSTLRDWVAQRLMARHLRTEHRWSIRRIGREIGATDTEVMKMLGEDR